MHDRGLIPAKPKVSSNLKCAAMYSTSSSLCRMLLTTLPYIGNLDVLNTLPIIATHDNSMSTWISLYLRQASDMMYAHAVLQHNAETGSDHESENHQAMAWRRIDSKLKMLIAFLY